MGFQTQVPITVPRCSQKIDEVSQLLSTPYHSRLPLREAKIIRSGTQYIYTRTGGFVDRITEGCIEIAAAWTAGEIRCTLKVCHDLFGRLCVGIEP
jgi:hypothetical protein